MNHHIRATAGAVMAVDISSDNPISLTHSHFVTAAVPIAISAALLLSTLGFERTILHKQ